MTESPEGLVDRRTQNPATGGQSGSDPVAATKKECALHALHSTPGTSAIEVGFGDIPKLSLIGAVVSRSEVID
jgi:hypothetical protein